MNAVLERDLPDDPKLDTAREFVRTVLNLKTVEQFSAPG